MTSPSAPTSSASRSSLTIGLLWHSPNSSNLGVGALTVSQIAILEEIGERLNIDLKFLILGWKDPEPVYVTGDNVEVVGLRQRDLLRPSGLWRAARRCDLVLDIGAGDSFTDIYGTRRAQTQLISKIVVLLAGRGLVLSPQTIGPFNKTWARWLATRVMHRAKLVLTRDALSTDFLKKMGYRGKSIEATDVALRLPYDAPPPAEEGRQPRAGINVSGLLMSGGYDRQNQFGLTLDFPQLAERIITGLQERGAEVHLVGHVITDQMPVEDDYAACVALSERFPGTVVAPRFASPSEAKSYIAGLDFFTGARMHACIGAFSSGVPVVPLAYSRKFEGLFGTLGYNATADCRALDTDTALARVLDGYDTRAALAAEAAAALGRGLERLKAYETALEDLFRKAVGTGS